MNSRITQRQNKEGKRVKQGTHKLDAVTVICSSKNAESKRTGNEIQGHDIDEFLFWRASCCLMLAGQMEIRPRRSSVEVSMQVHQPQRIAGLWLSDIGRLLRLGKINTGRYADLQIVKGQTIGVPGLRG